MGLKPLDVEADGLPRTDDVADALDDTEDYFEDPFPWSQPVEEQGSGGTSDLVPGGTSDLTPEVTSQPSSPVNEPTGVADATRGGGSGSAVPAGPTEGAADLQKFAANVEADGLSRTDDVGDALDDADDFESLEDWGIVRSGEDTGQPRADAVPVQETTTPVQAEQPGVSQVPDEVQTNSVDDVVYAELEHPQIVFQQSVEDTTRVEYAEIRYGEVGEAPPEVPPRPSDLAELADDGDDVFENPNDWLEPLKGDGYENPRTSALGRLKRRRRRCRRVLAN